MLETGDDISYQEEEINNNSKKSREKSEKHQDITRLLNEGKGRAQIRRELFPKYGVISNSSFDWAKNKSKRTETVKRGRPKIYSEKTEEKAMKRLKGESEPKSFTQILNIVKECEQEYRIENQLNPFVIKEPSSRTERRIVQRVTSENVQSS